MPGVTLQQAMEMAVRHHQAGQLREAQSIYRQILAADPNQPDALHFSGLVEYQTGNHRAALDLIGRAVRARPTAADYHGNLGLVLAALNRTDEAIVAYRRALSLHSEYPEALNNLGNALRQKSELEEAAILLQKAIDLRPQYAEAHNNLGIALRQQGQTDRAIDCFRRAISISPRFPRAHANLGQSLREQGDFSGSVAACRAAIALNPSDYETRNNLGIALLEQGQFDEAIEAFERALQIRGDFPEALNNLGNARRDLGQLEPAMDAYRRAASLRPDWAIPNYNLGTTLLLSGDLPKGWPLLEWRWRDPEMAARKWELPQPQWDGSELSGRRLLLFTEQGYGDAIQFARYVPLAAERGARVVLVCAAELERLFRSLNGVEQIVAPGQTLPDVDVQCALMSLPMIFLTSLETIPNRLPYLKVDEALSSRWRERVSTVKDGMKIGLAWAGRATHRLDRLRSISAEDLSPLTCVQAARFFSLQKRNASQPASAPIQGIEIIDWTNELNDFADTAALIDNLDLVITVDTAIAHLAGAMGKKVWVLLPFSPDWRWMRDRTDSPWYPTMRLFRQPKFGDWKTPMAQIADLLQNGTT